MLQRTQIAIPTKVPCQGRKALTGSAFTWFAEVTALVA